ncbi:MAG: metalloregulator ArsR/SmtB family transcription factor [Patescibacteria group bacterium]
MVKYKLDSIFSALSDPTRRNILQRLALGELSVGEIAEAYNISLVAVSKHLTVLERAKLISKERRGRQHVAALLPVTFRDASEHLHYYEMLLNNRLDSLEEYLHRNIRTAEPKADEKRPEKPPIQQELIFTHIFDAPRERVWKAYTDAEQIPQWWGPKDSTLIACDSDVRPGGIWRFVLRGSDGQEYTFSGIFREVSPHGRLVYTDGFGEATEPRPESLVAVTLDELPGGRTKLTKASVATPAVHQLQAALLSSVGRKV